MHAHRGRSIVSAGRHSVIVIPMVTEYFDTGTCMTSQSLTERKK